MYQTQKNQIRRLTTRQFTALRELCRLSKNMYNVALYNVRQYFFTERKRLTYESNYHICKENENYRLLNTDIAQQTMKVVDRSFKSFFGLVKAIKSGTYTQQIQIPRYLHKEGYFVLILPRIEVKEDGFFKVPMSREFEKQFGAIRLQFPERLQGKNIREVRIHPKYNARFFDIEFIYEEALEPKSVSPDIALAIDLGVNNLAACTTSTGASFLIDGLKLKSINQWYNRENARLQSIKDKVGFPGITNRQSRLYRGRANRVRDYFNKSARYIINYCIDNNIGQLIIGYNPGIKQESSMGRHNNQKFVQIPHYSLKTKLASLCERYGIEFIEQEESYTSKASLLDLDEIPVYNADNPSKHKFSGRRVKRGLYRASNKRTINADINGSGNILRKRKHNLDLQLVSKRLLASPLRIKIS